jgi:tetratricopeptide (TPR) repeat protein
MKQAEKEKSGKKGGILGFLFGGWHKIVTILVVLALIGGGILMLINRPKMESYETRKEKDIAARDAATLVEDDARTLVDIESSEERYAEAKKLYEDAIKNSSAREVVFLKIEYAEFIFDNTKDFQAAVDILEGVKAEIDTEIAAEFYNYRVGMLYYEAGAGDEFQEVSVGAK